MRSMCLSELTVYRKEVKLFALRSLHTTRRLSDHAMEFHEWVLESQMTSPLPCKWNYASSLKNTLRIKNAIIHGMDKPVTIIYSPTWVSSTYSLNLSNFIRSNFVAFRANEYNTRLLGKFLEILFGDFSIRALISPSSSFVKIDVFVLFFI